MRLLEIGLVNHVFEQSSLMDEAMKMAKQIASNATLAEIGRASCRERV